MTEELERREKAFAAERNEEQAARSRLKACLNFFPASNLKATCSRGKPCAQPDEVHKSIQQRLQRFLGFVLPAVPQE